MSLPSAHYRINGDGSIEQLVDPSSIVWGPPRTVPFKEYVMKKEVVHFECDNCHEPSEPEDLPPRRSIQPILPEDWAHIVGNTNHTRLFDLDLCTKCVEAMRKALLRRSKVVKK
ncbi:hypothetical protein PBI_SHEPARD_60 [Arthrobacter phage Shepard]|nr:hypothetical protein PBI_SHEPARD_60 [Arthrobacter phage Shepard]